MNEARLQRRLAAILIADAVGFSELMGRNEARTLVLLKERRKSIERAVKAHGGRVFGGAGDSTVAEFPSAVEAVRAAIAMQSAIESSNADLPKEDGMMFRVGVNLGDVVVEDRNLLGDGVNVTERLQALAPPGGICVSGSVHEQVRDKLAVAFADAGEQSLKNIARPVRAYVVGKAKNGGLRPSPTKPARRRYLRIASVLMAIAALAVATWLAVPFLQQSHDQTNSGPPTLAVLPFENLSGDPTQDYFGDGIAADITTALGRFAGIAVIGRHAARQFGAENADSSAVRKQLGAEYVVEGSVRKSGNRVRVTVSLTDSAQKLQLWSQQYDRELGEIFAVQDEIVQTVASLLVTKVSRVELERAFVKPTASLDAYDLYLRGWFEKQKHTRADNAEARALFEQSIARDPRFAAAIVALGFTYIEDATAGWTMFYEEFVGKAKQQAERALAIDPGLAEGYQLLADVYLARGDYDRALAEIERAIKTNPSDAYGHASKGWILMWIGDAKGAIGSVETGLKLDPTLDEFNYRPPLGIAYFLDGRLDEAVAVLEPIAGKNLDSFAYLGLAAAYAELGRNADARRAANQVKRLAPFFTVADFAAQWRDKAAADRIAAGLIKAGLN